MKYATLGNSGLTVSRLALGCMSFGERATGFNKWALDYEESLKVIEKALSLGFTYFDTANAYSSGTSEQFLGRALKALKVPRDKVFIQTKVFFNEGHLSRAAIFREIDQSLANLGTDYVDSYVIHRYDYGTPIEETLEALDSLVKAGKVRTIGASAMYAYQFHTMQESAITHGWTAFSSMQSMYNLLYREDEREMNPVCGLYDVALTPYTPLAAGRLSRLTQDSLRHATDPVAQAKFDGLPTAAADEAIRARVQEVATAHDATMTQVALAWLFVKGVTAPIIGATKPEYLTDAVGALDLTLSDEEVAYLEALYQPHKIVGALSK